MRAAQKETLEQAAAVQKTVAVMEPNWQALIASQKLQVETLAQILERMMLLATDTDVQATLQNLYYTLETRFIDLNVILHEYDSQISGTAREAEKTITAVTQDAQKKISSVTAATEARFGQLSEKFSNAISEQQGKMRKWMLRCLLISLIPSVLQLILLLMQLI
jgi:hypothetical protein